MINQFLWGAITMACAISSAFFFKYWRLTKDRLFLAFALAFFALAVNWLGLALINPENEARTSMYWVRLVAFLLIIAAIVDKNRNTPPAI